MVPLAREEEQFYVYSEAYMARRNRSWIEDNIWHQNNIETSTSGKSKDNGSSEKSEEQSTDEEPMILPQEPFVVEKTQKGTLMCFLIRCIYYSMGSLCQECIRSGKALLDTRTGYFGKWY